MAVADIGKVTKLPEATKPPLQRWQQLPTRQRFKEKSPTRMKTPKKVCNPPCKTPKSAGKPKTPVHGVTVPKSLKTPKSMGKPKTPGGCRFLPSRGTNEEYGSYLLMRGEMFVEDGSDSADEEENVGEEQQGLKFRGTKDMDYQSALMSMACNGEVPRGILTFRNTTPANNCQGSFLNYTANSSIGSASLSRSLIRESHQKRERRKVSTDAEKILDAPQLMNDYYLNTLDWGRNNVLAVALGSAVYLWNASEASVCQLVQLPEDEGLYVSGVSWADTGKYLAVGVSNGDVQLWDVAKEKKVRTMRGHEDRVSSLHWNSYTLSSGSRSGEVHIHDVRKPQHCISELRHHKMEVCGLRWSPDGRHLASGGNDNLVCLWNPSTGQDVYQILSSHTAAVKALAWCPWQQNLLATGGGTNDKTIKFWNATTGECQQSLNTKSQVSSVMWSKDSREIISSHGGPRNQITIWNYPSLTKVAELKGHGDRILNMALSPRRTRVISAGADETLRIWRCFDVPKSQSSRPTQNDSLSTALLEGMY